MAIRVSFDFDGCIGDNRKIQQYAQQLMSRGVEVHITTTRWDRTCKFCAPEYYRLYQNNMYFGVLKLAHRLGIPFSNVHFTNYTWKGEWLRANHHDFLWHLDDNAKDEGQFWGQTKTHLVDCMRGHWKIQCEKLIYENN